jgi:hypothetical protein
MGEEYAWECKVPDQASWTSLWQAAHVLEPAYLISCASGAGAGAACAECTRLVARPMVVLNPKTRRNVIQISFVFALYRFISLFSSWDGVAGLFLVFTALLISFDVLNDLNI